jgi:spore germination protein PF
MFFMPANIFGPVTINNIGGAAIVEFGDTVFISPKNASKSYHGSGSSNTGAQVINNNGISSTGTVQSSLIDQPISAKV